MTDNTMHVPIFKGEGRLAYEDRPLPRLASDHDVVLAIIASGICGTDLNILAVPAAHKAPPGIIIGHEGVARVHAVGANVSTVRVGERVVIAPRITCGNCAYCRRGLDNQCANYQSIGTSRDGTFAPYMLAPESALFALSDAVSLDDAALFEPLSCVIGAYAKAPVHPGDSVAVIGAGPMGALFALVAKAHGAGRVIMADVAPFRLDWVQRELGAIPVNSRERDLKAAVLETTGIGADIVIDAVGNQLASAVTLARRGGSVILFGLRPNDTQQVNQYTITRNDLRVVGAFVGLHPFVATVNALETGVVAPGKLITHRLPLSALEAGVALMRGGEAMKVLIEMQ